MGISVPRFLPSPWSHISFQGEVSLITGSFHVLVPCPFGWVGYGGLVVAFWHIWSSSTGLLAFASWTGLLVFAFLDWPSNIFGHAKKKKK